MRKKKRPGASATTLVAPAVYTVRDLAQMLRCSRGSVRLMLQRGALPAVRVNRRFRVTAEALHAFLHGGAR